MRPTIKSRPKGSALADCPLQAMPTARGTTKYSAGSH